MPNRILRDWTDSAKFDGISAEAERLFIRLLMKADDFGRFHANPKLVKSACFPLAEDLRANTVAAWLTELSDRQLVFCYTSGTGQYLAIINFRQRLKESRPKFPQPQGKEQDWRADSLISREVPGSSGNFRPETQTETEAYSETETKTEKGRGAAPLPHPSLALSGTEDPTETETDQPPQKADQRHSPSVAVKEVFDAWNALEAFHKCLVLSDKRRRHLEARVRNGFFAQNWRAALRKIEASDFCRGQNDRGWKANLDWFITPDAVAKIMEGKYDNVARGGEGRPASEPQAPVLKLYGNTYTLERPPQRVEFPRQSVYEACIEEWTRWKAKLEA
jgi:hypothetical protein